MLSENNDNQHIAIGLDMVLAQINCDQSLSMWSLVRSVSDPLCIDKVIINHQKAIQIGQRWPSLPALLS